MHTSIGNLPKRCCAGYGLGMGSGVRSPAPHVARVRASSFDQSSSSAPTGSPSPIRSRTLDLLLNPTLRDQVCAWSISTPLPPACRFLFCWIDCVWLFLIQTMIYEGIVGNGTGRGSFCCPKLQAEEKHVYNLVPQFNCTHTQWNEYKFVS